MVLASMDRLDLVEVAGREDISSLAEQLGVELLHLS